MKESNEESGTKEVSEEQVLLKPSRKQLVKAVSYPALLIAQNQHRFYFTTIPVDDIFPSCFVSRRDDDALQGFQRALNSTLAGCEAGGMGVNLGNGLADY